MANFSASLDTYTDPNGTSLLASGPDHAADHTAIHSNLIALENNIGTNSGTSFARNMVAGNFITRINSSNVLQQVISGTVNTTIGTFAGAVINTPLVSAGTWSNAQLIGTPQVTGGTVANALVGTSQHTGGTVTAVVMTASNISGGTVTATEIKSGTATVNTSSAAVPSSGQVLTATGITTATWQTPLTTSTKIITATKNVADSNALGTYTGVGFTPTSIEAVAEIDATSAQSTGFSDSAGASACVAINASAQAESADVLIYLQPSGGAFHKATISSYTSDGFVLLWTKTGSPTGTGNLKFLCRK